MANKRLIDADALKRKAVPDEETGEGIVYVQDIDEAPTVDADEVVRCRDCNWGDKDGCCMNPKCGKSWYGCPVPDEHFCSYGERRE